METPQRRGSLGSPPQAAALVEPGRYQLTKAELALTVIMA